MIQAVRRMLKVRPIRSATLLVFGFHAPSMMSLLGVATDITWCPALVAAMVEPLRLSLMVLKGAGLASLADIASDPSSKNDVIELVITVVAFIMVLIVVVAAVRTAIRELKEGDAQLDLSDDTASGQKQPTEKGQSVASSSAGQQKDHPLLECEYNENEAGVSVQPKLASNV